MAAPLGYSSIKERKALLHTATANGLQRSHFPTLNSARLQLWVQLGERIGINLLKVLCSVGCRG